MFSTCEQFKIGRLILCWFSFKLNKDSFIQNIYYNKRILFLIHFFFFKLVNWEGKGNFNDVL